MKDTSRPHPVPSSRSAPYRKCKSFATVSPTRGTRWAHDASQGHTREMISPRLPDQAHGSRRDGAQPPRTISPADDGHRSLAKTGGNHAVSHTRRHTSADGSTRERPSHTSVLSTRANVPGPSLRLPLASAPPTINTFTGQRRPESPPPGSVTTFLRSIELPDKPFSAPALHASFSLTTPSLRLPPLSTDGTNNKTACASTNGNSYQVNLVHKGYPFTYDLSTLPEDPKGMIALLNLTKSDPGAYLLVGAHYRRTGRSRAARAVIRSLLDNLDNLPDAEKGKGDAAPVPPSETSTVTLVSPDSPCPKPIGGTVSVFKSAAMRPAMLLLAACELDISREHPNGPESAGHASTARELFRAVYGTVNDAIVAGAVRPQSKNALGLEFSGNRNCLSFSPSDASSHPPSSELPTEVESLARVKALEKELSAARMAQEKLQEKLTASNDRLTRAEGKVHALESHSREVLDQLDAWQDENLELRQRLVESEQRARELAQCAPSAENRVWGRLKDLLFDNLGGVRSE
ncbi:hypothetical protein J3R82DRAFT_10333 [Butyriboletus roseoflavus]|nr:hypothetical protein J3R82DRAFT_10333 [Butyriboletus roseoflavus]